MSTSIETPTAAAGHQQIPMSIRIYNTLSRAKQELEPVVPGKVGIYLCGPTVYAPAHLGHAVGPVIFDAIKRYLIYCGFDVTWVVNITDVDDKLIKKSQEQGVTMSQLAEAMTDEYLQNLRELGVDQIDYMPRATECMDDIIAFTAAPIERDFAYEVDGDVFFDVAKDPEYGKLTNRTVDQLQGEGGEAAAKKRSSADFALWKSAKPGEPSWDSPWGQGRPGWHIECSAMSRKLLGETFDIHGGGLDLVFPHHENEVAQSECCHGKPMARIWMHNGLLRREQAGKIGGRADAPPSPDAGLSLEEIEQMTQKKEARSKGAGGLTQLLAEHGGEKIRFFLLRTHYRSTVAYGDAALEEAAASLQTFYRFFERLQRVTGEDFYQLPIVASRSHGEIEGENPLRRQVKEKRAAFLAKMDDDFNTGGAISELFDLVKLLNKHIDQEKLEDANQRDATKLRTLQTGVAALRELSAVLGLFRQPPAQAAGDDDALVGQLMDLLIQLRADSRKRKDFETADKIRDSLTEMGIALEDRKDGTAWRLES